MRVLPCSPARRSLGLSLGLAVLLASAGCQEEEQERPVSAPATAPDASSEEPAPPEPANGDVPAPREITRQVGACFDDFEETLAGMPMEERAAKISEVSAVIAECSAEGLRDDGYQVTDEVMVSVLRAMKDRSEAFMQKLIEMGASGE